MRASRHPPQRRDGDRECPGQPPTCRLCPRRVEGSTEGTSRSALAEMADLVADGRIDLRIVATYPLEQVRDAFAKLEQGHTHGKIVLYP